MNEWMRKGEREEGQFNKDLILTEIAYPKETMKS